MATRNNPQITESKGILSQNEKFRGVLKNSARLTRYTFRAPRHGTRVANLFNGATRSRSPNFSMKIEGAGADGADGFFGRRRYF